MDFLEYKQISGAVKDIDPAKRKVIGYLSSFNGVDKIKDTIPQGAYRKTIAERKDQIFFLNQHDWKQPLSKFDVLQEDSKGLYFESGQLPDTSYGNDVIKLYEAGILKEHSIGFQIIKADFDKKSGIRTLNEIKLFEGSCVTIGCDSNTPFLGMKAGIKEVNERTATILKAMRNGTFTDETFALLEIALKQLQKESFDLGVKSLAEPSQDTQLEPMTDEAKAIFNYLNTK